MLAFPKPRGRVHDADFLRLVHELPCVLAAVPLAGPCWGGIEANHVGERPLGRKADDDTCIPMCSMHHREWTSHGGIFRVLGRDARREWARRRVEETRARVAQLRGVEVIA